MADAETDEQPRLLRAGLHSAIREKLDPGSVWIADADIQQVIRICPGDTRRAIHKCLLSMLYRARHQRNRTETIRIRRLLYFFENDLLEVYTK